MLCAFSGRNGCSTSDISDEEDLALLDMTSACNIVDGAERTVEEEGNYMSVKHLVRLLDSGPDSKIAVDRVIDACSLMINLRIAIARFKKHSSGHSQVEMQSRNRLFNWGVAYLERYCLLIAFSSYLDHTLSGTTLTFVEWIAGRPDLGHLLQMIKLNPAFSLSTVQAPASIAGTGFSQEQETEVMDQEKILSQRKGSVLSSKTILKSYHTAGYIRRSSSQLLGLPEMYSVDKMPIYSVGEYMI